MYPNGNSFKAKLVVLSSRVDRVEQGIAREQIGLGWSDKSRYYKIRAD